MRVLTVVLALAAMPFAAGVAQETDPFSDPKNCGAHLQFSDRAVRADAALPHGGKHGVMDRPCGSTETPSACQVSEQVSGGLTISGKVSDGASGGPLEGWCIQLTGPVTATAMTGPDGTYRFTGLPDGTYSVCEVLQSGWQQTFPAVWMSGTQCPGNVVGWTFPLGGANASGEDFRNILAQ